MAVIDSLTCDFRLESASGRGFVMGFKSGVISLNFSLQASNWSLDSIAITEARAIAGAILEAAAFAEVERARRDANIAAVSAQVQL